GNCARDLGAGAPAQEDLPAAAGHRAGGGRRPIGGGARQRRRAVHLRLVLTTPLALLLEPASWTTVRAGAYGCRCSPRQSLRHHVRIRISPAGTRSRRGRLRPWLRAAAGRRAAAG